VGKPRTRANIGKYGFGPKKNYSVTGENLDKSPTMGQQRGWGVVWGTVGGLHGKMRIKTLQDQGRLGGRRGPVLPSGDSEEKGEKVGDL